MKTILSQLIQFQEFNLIRTEQKTQRHGVAIEALESSIDKIGKQLPPDIRQMITRMLQRDSIFIVPVAQSVCAGCGMKLPISLIQLVQRAQQLQHCPTCARILYFPDNPSRTETQPSRRSEPPRAGMARFSGPALMIPRLQATDRDGAILELAERVRDEGYVTDADKLWKAALRREAIVSTALDHGIAVPHVRGVEGGGITLALGISAKGIRFDDSDKPLTRMIFFLLIPTTASAFYLKLIAGIAETFIDAEARKTIMALDSPEKMWKALIKLTRKTIP